MQEDRGGDHEAEKGGAYQASDHDGGHGSEDFFAGLICGEDEGDDCYSGGDGGHEDGRKALKGTALDHLSVEFLALVLHEVKVVGEEHDGISRGDACNGDEADEGGDADGIEGEPGVEDRADE